MDPSFNEDQLKSRALALQRAEQNANSEHTQTLARREIIDKKKQSAATALAQKNREEETRKRMQAQQQQQAEISRLETEQKDRDARRLREQQQRVQREETERQLKELKQSGRTGIDLNDVDIDELDAGRIRAMKLAQLEKEKNELSERMKVTGRRIDHLERAFRREEIGKLPADYEEQKRRDLQEYKESTAEEEKDAKEKHKSDVALMRRLTRLVEPYTVFRDRKQSERRAEFGKYLDHLAFMFRES